MFCHLVCRCVIANVAIAHNRHVKWSLTIMRSLNYFVCCANYALHFLSESESELLHKYCLFVVSVIAYCHWYINWKGKRPSSSDLMVHSPFCDWKGKSNHVVHSIHSHAGANYLYFFSIWSQLRHARSLACLFVVTRALYHSGHVHASHDPFDVWSFVSRGDCAHTLVSNHCLMFIVSLCMEARSATIRGHS